MAYLAFDELGTVQRGGEAGQMFSADRRMAGLSPLEWTVVALARRDRLSSIRTPGRLATALGAFSVKTPSPRLADPRLETLRRAAVLIWHDREIERSSEFGDFLAAGFTAGQLDTIRASIGAASLNGAQRI